MKRLTIRRRYWFAMRHRRELWRKQKRRGIRPVSVISPSGTWRARPSKQNVMMPPVLCFDKSPAETIETLEGLRRALNRPLRAGARAAPRSRHRGRVRRLPRYRGFETLKEITPAAALVLAAEYERFHVVRGAEPWVANVEAWDDDVIEVLYEIGFFKIVGFGNLEPPTSNSAPAILPMRSGDTADSVEVSRLIEDLKGLYPTKADIDDAGMISLYGAMIEAIVNVVRHAYPKHHRFATPHIGRWWMTGAVDRSVRWMTAVVYDQGVTIPLSLPNWEKYAGWKRQILSTIGLVPDAWDTKSDGHAIAAAVEESASSTGERHRGLGLAQMREFVSQCRGGHLRIMSRCGEVVFRPRGSPEVRSHAASIGGTLIEWNVLL